MDFRYEMPKKQKVILIGYKKRVGKDTFANMLKDGLGCKETQILRFADPMKDIVADFMHLSVDKLNEYKNREVLIKDGFDNVLTNFRVLLQNFGNNKMKDYFGNDVWVRLLLKSVDPNSCYIIIPDFRCEIEYEVIKNRFGERNVFTFNIKNDKVDSTDTHKTENELYNFEFDFNVENNGDLEKLKQKAEYYAKIIKGI